MTSFWRKGRDTLHNGTAFGAILGLAIIWGAPIYTWIIQNVPSAWLLLGEWSLPLYVIGAGAILGYFIDRW